MWSFVRKAIPFLLASSGPPKANVERSIVTTTVQTPVTSVESVTTAGKVQTRGHTVVAWPPDTPQDMAGKLIEAYGNLTQTGPIYKQVKRTLRFSYVPPPVNGTTTWSVIQTEEELTADLLPDSSKPLAVYLPGLDGYGIGAYYYQFDDLARTFEFWRMTYLPEDRSSFRDVVKTIADFLVELGEDGSRPITLIGESCGALLALSVALRLRNTNVLQGLSLVNPATAFDRSAWDALVPLVTSLKAFGNTEPIVDARSGPLTPYSVAGGLLLAAVIPDFGQFLQICTTILGIPGVQLPTTDPDQIQNLLEAFATTFRVAEKELPADLLEHRVQQWMMVGIPAVNARLQEINIPTHVTAGKADVLLPSEEESKRLATLIPDCETLLVNDRGHFVLFDDVNLTEAILYSKIDPLNWKEIKGKYDPIQNWKRPTKERASEVIKDRVDSFRNIFSPIYVSTDENGKRWRGVSKVPRADGPMLFVGNHQFMGLDLRLIVAELLEKRGIIPRGLAHPVALLGLENNDLYGRKPGLTAANNPFSGDFAEFGAVVVNPRNYFRLLQTGQDVLLFPGGAKEALSGDQTYPMYWPNKSDFVRTAARFNATIVPLSAIGMLDSFNYLADPEQVLNSPILGDWASSLIENQTQAARYDEDVERIFFPAILPSVPARNYLLFGKPVSTVGLDPKDKDACYQVYKEIESQVRVGIDELLEARKKDPFNDSLRRLAYERVFGKQAPTFPIELLNKKVERAH